MTSERDNLNLDSPELAVALMAALDDQRQGGEPQIILEAPYASGKTECAVREMLDGLAGLCIKKPKERVSVAADMSPSGFLLFLTSSDDELDTDEIARHLSHIWGAMKEISRISVTLPKPSEPSSPRPLEIEQKLENFRQLIYTRFYPQLRHIVSTKWNVYKACVQSLTSGSPYALKVAPEIDQEKLELLTNRLKILLDPPTAAIPPSVFSIVKDIQTLIKDKDLRFLRCEKIMKLLDGHILPDEDCSWSLSGYFSEIIHANILINNVENFAMNRSFRSIFDLSFNTKVDIPQQYSNMTMPQSRDEWAAVAKSFLSRDSLIFRDAERSLQTILDAYSSTSLHAPSSVLRVRVHSELELVEYLHVAGLISPYTSSSSLSSHSLLSPTYIGTSEEPCSPCSRYLHIRGVGTQSNSFDYKFPWHLPNDTTPEESERFMNYLTRDMSKSFRYADIAKDKRWRA